jgi:chemotaxis protein MotB
MSGHGRGKGGRRGGAHEEEHENSERWLVSYADMMTLLMVLFIVMFAISQVDQRKFAMLKDGLTSGFGATVNVPVSGGTGINNNDGVIPEAFALGVGLGTGQGKSGADQKAYKDSSTGSKAGRTAGGAGSGAGAGAVRAAAQAEVQRLAGIEAQIRAALRAKGLQGDVRFRVTDRGLVVALLSGDVYFADASATLRPRGVEVLAAIDPTVSALPNDIAVEGHANNLAISSSVYPTNWELSAARAAGVVRWLNSNGGIADTRLSATGYGSSRPLYPSSDARAITFNRRVDIVLISNQSAEVRAQLPVLGSTLSDL